jgi:hypothetical protein
MTYQPPVFHSEQISHQPPAYRQQYFSLRTNHHQPDEHATGWDWLLSFSDRVVLEKKVHDFHGTDGESPSLEK